MPTLTHLSCRTYNPVFGSRFHPLEQLKTMFGQSFQELIFMETIFGRMPYEVFEEKVGIESRVDFFKIENAAGPRHAAQFPNASPPV